MSRYFFGIYSNGEYKVAQYGHDGGDPQIVGVEILKDIINLDINSFKEKVNKLEYYTDKEIHDFGTKDLNKLYYEQPWLERGCGADIINYIENDKVNKVLDKISFAADTLFCQWGYVLDLDNNTFEIFTGDNTDKLDSTERFSFLNDSGMDGYYPIKLLKKYNIDKLPTENEFLNDIF